MKALRKALIAILSAALGCCFFASCISTKLSVTYVVDGETYRVQDYDMDTQISLPTPPTKEGHTFIGWYTDEALTVPYAEGKISAGLTLYAKFEVSSVYIIVNTDGGEKIEAIEVVPGGDYTVPEATKEGYTFLGYTYIDENGDEVDFPLSGKYPANVGIRITAKYAINKYDVTFVADEETTVEVAHGSVAIAPATDKVGYTFDGWYTSATEQTADTKFDLATAITGEITLYAKYTPKTFTITVNGAELGYVNPQVVYGETYTLVTPNRGENYEFVKFTRNGEDFPATGTYTWTEDIAVEAVWDGTGKDIMFFDGNKELTDLRIETEYDADLPAVLPAVPEKAGYETDGKWYTEAGEEFVLEGKVTGDIRLYAKYTAIEYTVTFLVWDKATKEMKEIPVPVLYGETVDLPDVLERDSYDFKGYFYNGELFDNSVGYSYTMDITVEQKWELRADASLFEYVADGDYFVEREDYDDEWTYVYLVNSNKNSDPYTYTFAESIVLTMVTEGGDAYATVEGNTLTTKKAGEFVIQVNNNDNVYERTVKTVDEVASLTVGGTSYDSAWGLNAEGTDYKRNATDVWDKKVAVDAGEMMKVGRNNFIPELNINGGITTIDKANVVIEVTVDGEATADYTVANGAINFGESLSGKAVSVSIEPRYAVDSDHKVVYNVQLNEGVNVYTNDDLKVAYANAAIKEINVLRNIMAALSADQTNTIPADVTGGYPVTCPKNGMDEDNATGVYQRENGSLKLNGNYFTVDGSAIPLVDGRDGRGHNVEAYALQNVQFSIFLFGTRNVDCFDTCTMENLNVIGNGDMDATAKTGYLIDGKEVLKYSGGCIGIQVGGGTLALNNVTSRFGAFAVNAYAGDPMKGQDGNYTHRSKVVATDCKFEKSWANNMYIWGFGSITLNSCYIGSANGAAIHFDARPSETGVNGALTLNDTTIENWVIGTEAWFQAYNADQAVGSIKTQVEGAVGALGGMVGTPRTVTKGETVNFVFLMKQTGDEEDWIPDPEGQGTIDVNFASLDVMAVAPILMKVQAGGTPTAEEYAFLQSAAPTVMTQYAQFVGSIPSIARMMGYVEIINA